MRKRGWTPDYLRRSLEKDLFRSAEEDLRNFSSLIFLQASYEQMGRLWVNKLYTKIERKQLHTNEISANTTKLKL